MVVSLKQPCVFDDCTGVEARDSQTLLPEQVQTTPVEDPSHTSDHLNVRITYLFLILLGGWMLPSPVRAQAHRMPAAAEGLFETGVPNYLIRSQDAIGLSSPPSDFHLLPDGRLLMYARQEIALGDGVRWDVFRQAPDDVSATPQQLAMGPDGELYAGTVEGFAKVVFDEHGTWRLRLVAPWSAEIPQELRQAFTQVIQTDGTWFWHTGAGTLVTWRPGEEMRIRGRADTISHAFLMGGSYYLSDHTSGQLSRLHGKELEPIAFADHIWSNESVTCSLQHGSAERLVGTVGRGLQLFNGSRMHPLSARGIPATEDQINHLCDLGRNCFAASVEGLGVAIFSYKGKLLQVLPSSIEPRVTHVVKLAAGRDGILWGLLPDGLLRIDSPSPLSSYEPYFRTPVGIAHVSRVDGRLLLYADGKVRKGVYDDDGRLLRLDDDSPASLFAVSVSGAMGLPVIGTDQGAFSRTESGWRLISREAVRMRILGNEPVGGRWPYAAFQECGWLTRKGDRVEIESFRLPGLDNLYSADTDKDGNYWLEMGNGRIARLRIGKKGAEMAIYGRDQGIPEGWVQFFNIDGDPRVNVGNHLLRYDRLRDRFMPDEEFRRRLPPYRTIDGRPARDRQGRLWLAGDGCVRVLVERNGSFVDSGERFPQGLSPSFFTFEEDGKVWMQAPYRLVRYDPAMPEAQERSLRAMITHLRFPASGRTVFVTAEDQSIPAVEYSDNSLTAHFGALGSRLDSPVSFEVLLEGADERWSPVGIAGTALFRNLKEGRYTLHVRPVTSDGQGQEARLQLRILPPWHRSGYAYLSYGLAAVLLLGLSIWLLSLLQRREKVRLARLVEQRTRELNDSYAQLASRVEENRVLSQAIEQSPVGIFITDKENIIIFANARLCQLSGYTREELMGRNPSLIYKGSVSEEFEAEVRSIIRKGESWTGQVTDRRKDGSLIQTRTTISPLRGPNGEIRFHLVLKEDISQWLADQESRRKLEGQLFQAQKLESIGTLAGGIAHDFNNILTGILGFCELARQAPTATQEVLEPLAEIRRAGLRAKDLVSNILTFSRRGLTQLEPIELSQPVEEAVRLIRATTPATIEIVSRLERGNVRADATQIQQVVVNLCTNAVQAMGQRAGRLELELCRFHVNERLAAEVNKLPTGPCMRLSVQDNGQGMDQATLSRIFDPFFTTKQQGQGTGLGLSIVQGIVTAHNGTLRVNSTPEAGTRFELFFPLSTEAPKVAALPVTEVPRGSRQQILIVDDERTIATYATRKLEMLGYQVTAYNDPREALAACRAEPDRFQALITDLTMPYMTGLELIEEVRSLGRLVPCIIITGHAREGSSDGTEVLPNCRVLTKPFDGDDLARMLSALLASQAPT
jgi:PAS domain S-box-containing protein